MGLKQWGLFVGLMFIGTFSFGSDLMEKGDVTYQERLDPAKGKEALAFFQELIEVDPQNVEAHWKAARSAWWVGDRLKKKREKAAYFKQGIELAQTALSLDDKSVESYFWLSANQGSYGEVKGILKSLFLVKPIRRSLEKILELNPAFDGGAAYRVLGVVDYKVPGFAGGSKKRAEERLLKAYEMAPANSGNLYYLAEFYKVRRKKEKARAYLKKLLSLDPAKGDYADIKAMQEKGERLHKKLK